MDELATAVGLAAARELTAAQLRIRHCVEQSHVEQIWWRSAPALNSIGNLVLHLCGNLRQWVIAGVGGEPDQRRRYLEFGEQEQLSGAELLTRLDSTVESALRVLHGLTAAQLIEKRRIQGFELTCVAAIFDSLAHFRGHAQEIVHITRLQLGTAYRFQWTPATIEEGRAPEAH